MYPEGGSYIVKLQVPWLWPKTGNASKRLTNTVVEITNSIERNDFDIVTPHAERMKVLRLRWRTIPPKLLTLCWSYLNNGTSTKLTGLRVADWCEGYRQMIKRLHACPPSTVPFQSVCTYGVLLIDGNQSTYYLQFPRK